jgi:hypothetical protein
MRRKRGVWHGASILAAHVMVARALTLLAGVQLCAARWPAAPKDPRGFEAPAALRLSSKMWYLILYSILYSFQVLL